MDVLKCKQCDMNEALKLHKNLEHPSQCPISPFSPQAHGHAQALQEQSLPPWPGCPQDPPFPIPSSHQVLSHWHHQAAPHLFLRNLPFQLCPPSWSWAPHFPCSHPEPPSSQVHYREPSMSHPVPISHVPAP